MLVGVLIRLGLKSVIMYVCIMYVLYMIRIIEQNDFFHLQYKFTYIHTYVYAHTGSTVIVGENINGGGGDKGVDFFSVSALLLVYVCMSSLADICSGEI